MFPNNPKKRKQKEKNISPPKSSKRSGSPTEDIIIMPSIVNWSDISSQSKPSSSKTLPSTDKNSPSSSSLKPASPDPIDLSKLDEYANLASTTDLDWDEVEDYINKPASPDPVDLSRLDEYANLTSWQDIQTLIDEAPILNTSDIPEESGSTNNFASIFSLGNITSSTILNPPIVNDSDNETSSTILNPPIANDSDNDLLTDDEEDDNDRPLTSDDLFKLMKTISDNINSKTLLNIDIFKRVRRYIPHIDETIENINTKTEMMGMPQHNRHQIAAFSTDIRNNIVVICNILKETYPLIYPSKQILGLIQLDRDNLSCIPILNHEKELDSLLYLLKKHTTQYSRKIPSKEEAIQLRRDNIRVHIYNIEEAYKRIYNLK
ncbi:MAG: hypothetical protein KFW09_04800 [Oscillospiraceae bacterium]|nr:hypothetical protein [Oscillospiraceae bacterium]